MKVLPITLIYGLTIVEGLDIWEKFPAKDRRLGAFGGPVCESNADCFDVGYCSEGECRVHSTCRTFNDCLNPSNIYGLTPCVGVLSCSIDGFCGIECGDSFCPPGQEEFNCFPWPCQVETCDEDHESCANNICGGCHSVFFDAAGREVCTGRANAGANANLTSGSPVDAGPGSPVNVTPGENPPGPPVNVNPGENPPLEPGPPANVNAGGNSPLATDSTTNANAGGYFPLESRSGPGCIAVENDDTDDANSLILGACGFENHWWSYDSTSGMIRSFLDDSKCMQIGYGGTPGEGTRVRLFTCDEGNNLQRFDYMDSHIRLRGTDLCVTYQGSYQDVGNDPILVLSCNFADNREGWGPNN